MLNSSIRLTGNLLLASAAATLLRRGHPTPTWLMNILGQSSEERWTPHPDALVPTALGAPDGYWISKDPILPMAAAGWLGAGHPLGHRDQNVLMNSVLEKTKGGDPGFLASLVLIMVDLKRVDDALVWTLRERLHEILDDSVVKSEPTFLAVTDALAKAYARLNDTEGFETWISKLASECSDRWVRMRVSLSEENEASKAAIALLNAVYIFASSGDRTVSECCSLIARNLRNVAAAWCASLSALINCLGAIAQHVDTPTAADEILPTLLELRSR